MINSRIYSSNYYHTKSPVKASKQALAYKNVCGNKEVSFSGLTRILSTRPFDTTEQIIEKRDKYHKANGIVGNLPSKWINMIPEEQREQKIKAFYSEFGFAISDFRDNKYLPFNKRSISKRITKAMQDAGILEENEKVKLSKLGEGAFGSAYLIKDKLFCDGDYVVKVFHNLQEDAIFNTHGTFVEVNRAAFWNKQVGEDTQRNTFYYGDLNNGYMMTRFVCSKRLKPRINVSPERYGLAPCDDKARNLKNGYDLDYGGMNIINKQLANSKTVRYVTNKLYDATDANRLKVFKSILAEKNKPNYTDKLIGLYINLDCFSYSLAPKLLYKLVEVNNSEFNLFVANKLARNKEKQVFAKLFEGADNKVNAVLAKKLFIFWDNEAEDWFQKLYDGSNSEVKQALAGSIGFLPEESKVKWFNKLSCEPDSKVKSALVDNLMSNFPTRFRIRTYNNFIQTADAEVKESLARNINCLPRTLNNGLRDRWFERLYEGAHNKLKVALAGSLSSLDPEQVNYWFKKLYEEGDDEVRDALVTRLAYLPTNDVTFWANKMCDDTENKDRLKFVNEIYVLPQKSRTDFFAKLFEGADNKRKNALADVINSITASDKKEWFIKLYDDSDNNTKITLACMLKGLSKEDIDVCFKKFENADDKVIDVLLLQRRNLKGNISASSYLKLTMRGLKQNLKGFLF